MCSGEARVPAARDKADQILADGRAAIARADAEGARQAINDLEVLRADLRREFVLRIVPSGRAQWGLGASRSATRPGGTTT